MASTAKHTPGPWIAQLDDGVPHPRDWYIDTVGLEEEIARLVTLPATPPYPEHDTYTIEANARLIAAAPQLLEAAKDALESLQHMTVLDFATKSDHKVLDKLTAAIKATTES